MKDGIRVQLAKMLVPEMYAVAKDASAAKLSAEIMQMALALICDELGRELQGLGYTEEAIHEIIMRGADRASMAGDIILMGLAQPNDEVTPADLLG